MKTINVLFLFLATALVLSSCQNLEKVLLKNDGSWNLVQSTENQYEDGVAVLTDSVTTYANPTVWKFNEDGTGAFTEDGVTDAYNWTYDEDAEVLSIEVDGIVLDFDVLEWTKSDMKLLFELEFDLLGTMFLSETVYDFEKAE
ncbi:MAG: hypothetical protein AB8H47_31380 [Bacteroidia bacterium]